MWPWHNFQCSFLLLLQVNNHAQPLPTCASRNLQRLWRGKTRLNPDKNKFLLHCHPFHIGIQLLREPQFPLTKELSLIYQMRGLMSHQQFPCEMRAFIKTVVRLVHLNCTLTHKFENICFIIFFPPSLPEVINNWLLTVSVKETLWGKQWNMLIFTAEMHSATPATSIV